MRQIKLHYRLAGLAVSALLSAAATSTYLYLGAPEQPKVQEIPVINFATAGIEEAGENTLAISASPFGNIKQVEVPEMPAPPAVPDMPMQSEMEKLTIFGVLPPDVVILGKGTDTVTARTGESTKFGTVGNISADGAYIDGTFIALK